MVVATHYSNAEPLAQNRKSLGKDWVYNLGAMRCVTQLIKEKVMYEFGAELVQGIIARYHQNNRKRCLPLLSYLL